MIEFGEGPSSHSVGRKRKHVETDGDYSMEDSSDSDNDSRRESLSYLALMQHSFSCVFSGCRVKGRRTH